MEMLSGLHASGQHSNELIAGLDERNFPFPLLLMVQFAVKAVKIVCLYKKSL